MEYAKQGLHRERGPVLPVRLQALVDLATGVHDGAAVHVGRRAGGRRAGVGDLVGGRLGDEHGVQRDAQLVRCQLQDAAMQVQCLSSNGTRFVNDFWH